MFDPYDLTYDEARQLGDAILGGGGPVLPVEVGACTCCERPGQECRRCPHCGDRICTDCAWHHGPDTSEPCPWQEEVRR